MPEPCTLIADTTNGTPAPQQSSSDPAVWALTSTSTPNENGYYVVRYHLPYPHSCCRLEFADPLTFQHPVGTAFAGFRSCDEIEGYDAEFSYQSPFFDLSFVGSSIKPCFNAFYLRSTEPFTSFVTITSNPCDENWCYQFDFTNNNGSFSAVNCGGWCGGIWNNDGQGWAATNVNGGNKNVVITRTFSPPITVMRVEVDFYHSIPASSGGNVALTFNTGTKFNITSNMSGETTQHWEGIAETINRIDIENDLNVNQGEQAYIRRVRLYGDGTNPVGGDNC